MFIIITISQTNNLISYVITNNNNKKYSNQ